MKIPQYVIESAIKSGWTWKESSEIRYQSSSGELLAVGCNDKAGNIQMLFPEKIILDPNFWEALGSEYKWYVDTPICAIDQYAFRWQRIAHQLFDLILSRASDEELDAYWQNISKK